ncbi:MAG: 50S ribosomal protein L27, partial [Gammaproteobacteria bacterium]|nr:50S ribosomal protein L27 [Gammaproteobacteria bacterium]
VEGQVKFEVKGKLKRRTVSVVAA